MSFFEITGASGRVDLLASSAFSTEVESCSEDVLRTSSASFGSDTLSDPSVTDVLTGWSHGLS